MTEVTVDQIFTKLSERGRLEWELAMRAAIIEAQVLELEALTTDNGHAPEVVDAL